MHTILRGAGPRKDCRPGRCCWRAGRPACQSASRRRRRPPQFSRRGSTPSLPGCGCRARSFGTSARWGSAALSGPACPVNTSEFHRRFRRQSCRRRERCDSWCSFAFWRNCRAIRTDVHCFCLPQRCKAAAVSHTCQYHRAYHICKIKLGDNHYYLDLFRGCRNKRLNQLFTYLALQISKFLLNHPYD